MLLSDLQSKDVVSVKTGDNLGRIIDVEISLDGKIINIYAETKKIFRKYFSNNEMIFKFTDIEKIGLIFVIRLKHEKKEFSISLFIYCI